MSLFAIADLHLSFSTNKPMNIFNGWDNYEERLEKNWRALVTDNDTVVIPGDISWAMKLNETYKDFKFINELPGKKLFLKGNHDYWWETRRKIEKFLAENKFDTIQIVFYEVWSTLALPNRFIDISETAEIKAKMLEAHKSQMALRNYLPASMGLSEYRALMPNVRNAEAFLALDEKTFVNLVKKIYI